MEQKLNVQRISSVKKNTSPTFQVTFLLEHNITIKFSGPLQITNRWYDQRYIGLKMSLSVFVGFER